MKNLQPWQSFGDPVRQRRAPQLPQHRRAAGGVGGAGAGQSDRREAGERLLILCVDAVGRGAVAEHRLGWAPCCSSAAMSLGTTSRMEASDAPVMVQLSSVSHRASPWRRMQLLFGGDVLPRRAAAPRSGRPAAARSGSAGGRSKRPSPGFWGWARCPGSAPGCGHRTPAQSSLAAACAFDPCPRPSPGPGRRAPRGGRRTRAPRSAPPGRPPAHPR